MNKTTLLAALVASSGLLTLPSFAQDSNANAGVKAGIGVDASSLVNGATRTAGQATGDTAQKTGEAMRSAGTKTRNHARKAVEKAAATTDKAAADSNVSANADAGTGGARLDAEAGARTDASAGP